MKINEQLEYPVPYVIAEACCNHRGDLDTAVQMIKVAASCGVNAVKFQKRCIRESLTPEQYRAPHPVPANAYGPTYGQHREALEFTIGQHRMLVDACRDAEVDYISSVWDMTSAKEVSSLGPSVIKIPSACNTNMEMLRWLCDNFYGEIQLSLGMTTRREEDSIVNLFSDRNRARDLVLFSCTSAYPVPCKDVCLLEITRLKKTYSNVVKAIGFSGHHLGTVIDIAAYMLGATVIERHFTLDKTWKGTDHKASLCPDELQSLCLGLSDVRAALAMKKTEILQIEQAQRSKLKSIVQESMK